MKSSRTSGWNSDLPTFRETRARVIRTTIQEFVQDASLEQVQAWDESIPLLQREAGELVEADEGARRYVAILEYQLPMESRRPDAVLLAGGTVVVIELKGKARATQADVDQAAAYARDLRAYHRECHERPVHAVLVPTNAGSEVHRREGVYIVGPEGLDLLTREIVRAESGETALSPGAFLDIDAYRPLPTLVRAARELFESRTVREIWKARSATEPTVHAISEVTRDAARTKTRRLVLVTGVPGSGKTLVGLRAVHADYLDDLAVARAGGKPTSPALFLSGNDPLVAVLQYELASAGGGGKAFVRRVKDYLDRLAPHAERIPSEHVIVFDEAQRAFSPQAVADKHPSWPRASLGSEPELFVRLSERVPEWSVIVGLIGRGQEIHKGEEEGIGQWRDALLASPHPGAWTVHAPAELEEVFAGSGLTTRWQPELNLDTEVRFHLTADLHDFVDGLLTGRAPTESAEIASRLHSLEPTKLSGLRLWITRDLDEAKDYLRERYDDDPDKRFGLLASSKDKVLEKRFGVPNSYQATKIVRVGPWFCDDERSRHSCRRLETVATEFMCQGLELDMALLAWGTDFVRDGGRWSNAGAGGYRGRVEVKDAHSLRLNAYRVLLTRGRDGTVVYVPETEELDETWEFLRESGWRELR